MRYSPIHGVFTALAGPVHGPTIACDHGSERMPTVCQEWTTP
jgi:hypothetical protein